MYFTVVIRLNITGCISCINMVNRDIMVDEDDENINYNLSGKRLKNMKEDLIYIYPRQIIPDKKRGKI